MVCFTIQVILGSFPRGCVRSSEVIVSSSKIASLQQPPRSLSG
jgi:hypothetical protein